MRVTAKRLLDAGAMPQCYALRWFKRRWPCGCETTLKNLTAAGEHLPWFAELYLRDHQLANDLCARESQLRANWDETVEKRIESDARRISMRFVRGWDTQKKMTADLKVTRQWRNRSVRTRDVNIAAEIARMVYDHIRDKRAPAKRRSK